MNKLKNDIRRAVISSGEDIETFDFIVNLINAYSNCDTWGCCDIEEKHEQCDRALDFMYNYFVIKED